MKILSRLRDLPFFSLLPTAPPVISPASPLIDRDDVDCDECFDSIGDDGLPDLEANYATVDGLRRRIPDLHEDFPPDALGMEDQQDDPI